MKKEYVAGLIAVLLVLSSTLALYIFVARTSSGQKATQFSDTVRFLGERVDSLERQRDLLAESASSLEEQATALKKRVRSIDAEIRNMREMLASAGGSDGSTAFSWRRLRITTASGLVIIAFLAFIWMLYGSSRRGDFDDGSSATETAAEEESGAGTDPVPGSVLEEEFSAKAKHRKSFRPGKTSRLPRTPRRISRRKGRRRRRPDQAPSPLKRGSRATSSKLSAWYFASREGFLKAIMRIPTAAACSLSTPESPIKTPSSAVRPKWPSIL